MSVTTEDSKHSVLALYGFELVIHKLSNEPPVERDEAGRLRARQDSYIKICLPVKEIVLPERLRNHQEATSRIVNLNGRLGDFVHVTDATERETYFKSES